MIVTLLQKQVQRGAPIETAKIPNVIERKYMVCSRLNESPDSIDIGPDLYSIM